MATASTTSGGSTASTISTSVSLLQEILKQLYTLGKPPPPMMLHSRLTPGNQNADSTQQAPITEATAPPKTMAQPEAEVPINIEKLTRIKEVHFGPADSSELEEFLLMYLETIQICKHEYNSLESNVQEVVKTIKEQQAKANKKKKRKRKNLSEASKALLKKWLADHWFHPYPTNEEKLMLCEQTGITLHSLNHWFINARRRNVLCYALGGNNNPEREIEHNQ